MSTHFKSHLAGLILVIPLLTSEGLLASNETGIELDASVAAPVMGPLERFADFLVDQQPAKPLAGLGATPCVDGFADVYPCSNVDLLAFMPLADIGGGEGNDIWGWTDPLTGSEYAIMGRTNGTAFVDVTDPENPVYVGNLPSRTFVSNWRDVKVYANHAFIVSEANFHGMQVFDLTELRDVVSPPVQFTDTAFYNDGDGGRPTVSNSHNVVINEDSGYAYLVGTNTCSGGLHMVDVSDPIVPVFAGCFSADGYTHDAQCVMYTGPDPDYAGAEICVNANEDTVTIVDVSDKSNPIQVSRTGYADSAYTHQGWFTEDHRYFLLDDELDEVGFGHNTRTRIWDVSDLDAPVLIGIYDGPTASIDHNLYVAGDRVYEANYRSGLAILDSSDVANGNLSEMGFFDVYPSSDSNAFNGAWSVYPYFQSGTLIVSGIEQGLFVLRFSGGLTLSEADPGVAGQLNTWTLDGATPSNVAVLVGGLGDGSQTISLPGCPSVSVDIASPFLVVPGPADAGGDATFSNNIPPAASGATLRFQAVDLGTCTTSPVTPTTFQ